MDVAKAQNFILSFAIDVEAILCLFLLFPFVAINNHRSLRKKQETYKKQWDPGTPRVPLHEPDHTLMRLRKTRYHGENVLGSSTFEHGRREALSHEPEAEAR